MHGLTISQALRVHRGVATLSAQTIAVIDGTFRQCVKDCLDRIDSG